MEPLGTGAIRTLTVIPSKFQNNPVHLYISYRASCTQSPRCNHIHQAQTLHCSLQHMALLTITVNQFTQSHRPTVTKLKLNILYAASFIYMELLYNHSHQTSTFDTQPPAYGAAYNAQAGGILMQVPMQAPRWEFGIVFVCLISVDNQKGLLSRAMKTKREHSSRF